MNKNIVVIILILNIILIYVGMWLFYTGIITFGVLMMIFFILSSLVVWWPYRGSSKEQYTCNCGLPKNKNGSGFSCDRTDCDMSQN
jgi:membrane protein implicated in regulation of membrane protease activity